MVLLVHCQDGFVGLLLATKAVALLPLKGENILAWGIAPGLKRLTSTSPERARHNLIFVSPFQGLMSNDIPILVHCQAIFVWLLPAAKALALLPLKGENILAWGIAPGLNV